MPDLQTLFNTVPIAASGDVISEEYHNSLRDTLGAVVNQLSGGPVSKTVTMTFAPAFLQNDIGPNWNQLNGVATNPPSPNANTPPPGANGWFPVQLPDGAMIQSMAVVGEKTGNMLSLLIQLTRQGISDSTLIQLIHIELKDATNPFNVTANVQASVPSFGTATLAAILADLQLVRNDTYKYLVIAKLVNTTPGDATLSVTLNAIQITYTR